LNPVFLFVIKSIHFPIANSFRKDEITFKSVVNVGERIFCVVALVIDRVVTISHDRRHGPRLFFKFPASKAKIEEKTNLNSRN
jgi:hypothetical protein